MVINNYLIFNFIIINIISIIVEIIAIIIAITVIIIVLLYDTIREVEW